jgi:PAS domain S-box-containing protein
MNLSQTTAPEYLEKSRQMLTRKLAGEEETVYDLEIMAKDGRRIAVEVNTRLIYQDGIPVSVQGIARDITARKRAEEERDRFFDLSGDLLCMADFNGHFKRLNPAWSKTLGFSEEELLAKPFNEFVHPDDRINTSTEVENLAAEGATINFENRYICKDGSYRWLSWSSTSVSELQTIYAVARDVTEIKEATEALREADQRAIKEYKRLLRRIASLAQILGSARDLATIFRALLIFARLSAPANSMLISLYDTETQVRQPVYAWSDGEEVDISKLQPMTNSPHSRAISAGEVGIVTDDLESESAVNPGIDIGDLRADRLLQSSLVVPMAVMGKVIGDVEIQSLELAAFREEHATAMQMAANLVANAIENVRLMDNEHEREEQLRQSQKMEAVGRLAGGVAHDFNNLLTAITGYSELTLKRLPGDDPLRRNVEEIKRAGERAASLTRQLLAFSRKQVLQPVVMDLQAVVSDMEKMLRRLIGEDIELRTVLGGELGSIKADPGQIEQVIMNLAVNARDAMPAGGKLTIETQNVYLGEDYATRHIAVKPGAYIMMAVTDTGTGMDEQTQRRIFEPFFTTKEMGKGTGLGLSTVYGIVKQSGGNIWVYSEVSRGTTFKIYLPRVDEGAQDYKRSAEVEESLYGTETILVAEDDERLRNLVREVLEGYSYKVLLAANGSVALSIFERQEEPVHLLLTDVIMPGMSGRELADRLTRLHPEIKTLYMSGYTDDAIVHHGVLDADTSFIQKPFDSAALARKVREVLGQSTGQGPSDKNPNNS